MDLDELRTYMIFELAQVPAAVWIQPHVTQQLTFPASVIHQYRSMDGTNKCILTAGEKEAKCKSGD